jgi:DHA1 family multidrug resistance protein-like MFS transporter
MVSLAMGLTGLALPLYARDLGASYTSIGLLGAMYFAFNFLFSPLTGRFADRHGRKIPLVAGFFLVALSLALYPLISAVWWLLAVRLLQGAAEAPLWVNAQTAVADLSKPSNRGRAMGIYGTSWGIGFAIGPFLGGCLYTVIGAKPLFLLGSLAALIAALVITTASFPKPQVMFKRAISKELWSACLIGLVYSGVVGVIFTIFPVYCTLQLGFSEVEIGLFVMLFAAVRVILFVPMGGISDRFSARPIIASGLLALAIASTALAFVNGYFLIAAAISLLAAAEGAIYPSVMSIVSKIGGQTSAYVLGIFNAVSVLGWGILPVAGGYLADNLDPVAPYLMCAAISLATLIFLWKFLPRKK